MRKIFMATFIFTLISVRAVPSFAEHENKNTSSDNGTSQSETISSDVSATASEVVVQVSGAVCSFCSLGIQRRISKLSFIDRSKYNKGSLMDIESQNLTIAIKPDETLDLKQIYKTILDGGYEPQGAYVNSDGGVVIYYNAEGQQCTVNTVSC